MYASMSSDSASSSGSGLEGRKGSSRKKGSVDAVSGWGAASVYCWWVFGMPFVVHDGACWRFSG